MKMRETWSNSSADSLSHTEMYIAQFGHVYENIGLKTTDFRGTVLTAGVGGMFPERFFICSPGSKYRHLYPGVDKLVLCDENYYPRFKVLDEEINHQILYEEGEQEIALGRVVSLQDSIWRILQFTDLSYDALTFCRIPDLPDQLGYENLLLLVSKLNAGGLALLSGSFKYQGIDLNQIVKTLNSIKGINATLKQLTDGGDLCNVGYGGHYGVVIRKG